MSLALHDGMVFALKSRRRLALALVGKRVEAFS
jgi:hypothetical protein